MNVRLLKKEKYSVTLRAGSTIHPLEKPTKCVNRFEPVPGTGHEGDKTPREYFPVGVSRVLLDCWTWDGQDQELRSKDFTLGEL